MGACLKPFPRKPRTPKPPPAPSPLRPPGPACGAPTRPCCLHPTLQTTEPKGKEGTSPGGCQGDAGGRSGPAGALQVSSACPGDLCPSWSGEPAPRRGPRRAAGWGLQPQSRQRGAPGRSPGPQAWEPTATPWPCLDRSCLPWTKGVPSPARSPALASLVLGAGPGKGSEGWACHSALPSPLSSLRKGPLPAPGPHASHLPHMARPRDLPLATRFSKALGCSAP